MEPTMTAIHGVEIKKDSQGEITHVSIDVREHKEAIPVLKEMGLLPEASEEKGHTIDEFYQSLVNVINEQYGTNH
jgi:hypothetical protein